eukprot:snap_masked-scaffold_87-processed-gene-0.20-mRNA-1 protein AED:1.00 eAED:1.00 QI:0/0/0/0/1/1/2/0/62
MANYRMFILNKVEKLGPERFHIEKQFVLANAARHGPYQKRPNMGDYNLCFGEKKQHKHLEMI